jgi:hypothetical protein
MDCHDMPPPALLNEAEWNLVFVASVSVHGAALRQANPRRGRGLGEEGLDGRLGSGGLASRPPVTIENHEDRDRQACDFHRPILAAASLLVSSRTPSRVIAPSPCSATDAYRWLGGAWGAAEPRKRLSRARPNQVRAMHSDLETPINPSIRTLTITALTPLLHWERQRARAMQTARTGCCDSLLPYRPRPNVPLGQPPRSCTCWNLEQPPGHIRAGRKKAVRQPQQAPRRRPLRAAHARRDQVGGRPSRPGGDLAGSLPLLRRPEHHGRPGCDGTVRGPFP